jgi:hypothetical protein
MGQGKSRHSIEKDKASQGMVWDKVSQVKAKHGMGQGKASHSIVWDKISQGIA